MKLKVSRGFYVLLALTIPLFFLNVLFCSVIIFTLFVKIIIILFLPAPPLAIMNKKCSLQTLNIK